MGRIVLKMHVSLDGCVRAASENAAGGPPAWMTRGEDEALRDWEVDLLWQAKVHVMGRKVYEEMAGYWPDSNEPAAAPMNAIPKVVFSRSIDQPTWGRTRVAADDVAAEFVRLKQEHEGMVLVHGGAAFARDLSAHGLIDEYRLIVHPVALGDGLRIFHTWIDLDRVASQAFPAGCMLLTYRPASA